jgi:hypothetical protein
MDCINIVEILVYLAICIIPTRFAYGIVVELILNQENKFICFLEAANYACWKSSVLAVS